MADFRHAHAHEHEQAHDLEATARAADAAADKDEHEEHEAREIRPVPARRGDKAARRQEGRRLEQAVAQALRRIVDTRAAEIPGDEHTAREKEPRVSLQFRIAQHEPKAQPVPDLPAEQRIEAREQHRDAGRELQRDAVIGDEVTRVSRAARRQRHHRLRQGCEGVEPCQQVEHKRKPRQRSVNTEALTRRLGHLVPDRAEKNALARRQRQAETAADLRQDSRQDDDEVEAAEPVHDAVPEDEAPRHVAARVVEAREPRRHDGGHALEERVDRTRQDAREHVGHHAEDGEQRPDEHHEERAFPDIDLALVVAAEPAKAQAESQREHGRHEEGPALLLMPEQAVRKRHEQGEPHDGRDAAHEQPEDVQLAFSLLELDHLIPCP